MGSIYDWSNTAANNSNADGDINWAEGQNPSTVNDSAREMMRKVATLREMIGGAVTSGGTSTAYTLTFNHAPSGYSQGFFICWEANVTCGASPTMNVNSLGAVNLVDSSGTNLVAGDIEAGGYYSATYDNTAGKFYVINLSKTLTSLTVSGAAVFSSTLTANGAATFNAPVDFTDTVDITGAFTSIGIDDNATAERLQLADTVLTIGADDVVQYVIDKPGATGGLTLSGGSSGSLGGQLRLYGESHGSLANDAKIVSGTSDVYHWDDSANQHEWFATAGTSRMTLDTNELYVDGDVRLSAGHYFKGAAAGSAALPVFSIDEDGLGGGTGIWGTNTGSSDYLGITVDGTEIARFEDGLGLQMLQNDIYRDADNGTLILSGGTDGSTGGNVRVFGGSHGSQANDIEFRTGTTIRAAYDASAVAWNFQDSDISGVDKLYSGQTNDTLQLGGGSTAALGANIILYSEAHGTSPDDFQFRVDTTTIYRFDASQDRHEYLNKDLADVGGIIFQGASWTQTKPAVSTWTEYDMGTYTTSTVDVQAHGLGDYPEDVHIYLECTTADNGYAVGDRLLISTGHDADSPAIAVQVDTTNIRVITGTALIKVPPKTGGTSVTLGTGDWKVIIRVRDNS